MKVQHSLCEYIGDGPLKHLHRCSELCSSHPCHRGPQIYFELHKVPHSDLLDPYIVEEIFVAHVQWVWGLLGSHRFIR